jgi:putative peptide zinc metalloprotease protein
MTEGLVLPLTRETAASAVSGRSKVTLIPLTVVEQDDGYIVGSPEQGTFIKLPPVGVQAIEHLRNGESVEAVSRALSPEPPDPSAEDVDVVDFVQTLIELGFVVAVDGAGIEEPTTTGEGPGRRWIPGPRPQRVRWLFSRGAWVLYGSAFIFCLVAEVTLPRYRPHPENFFFLSDPLVSIAILTVVAFILTGAHESFHWMAGSAQGISARFAISRRLYFLVFETDLTQLWSLQKRRRYGPILAGMALDSVVLAASIIARMFLADDIVWYRLLAAIGILETTSLVWQFCIFLRNDLYLVTSLALGCVNLWRITMLTLKGRVWHLSGAEEAELRSADPRDRMHARWFGALCVVGLAAAAWYAKVIVIPAVWHTIWSFYNHLVTSTPAKPRFWVGIIFGALALTPNALTIYLLIKDTVLRRR